ncbi:hypothetical protein Tamer19_64770 [Cupriavidus sp. TA19]|uniref:hypothetical protein n=1 Tax=unclassified Cupriavidus TaxID=2640874 RepID=UPI0027294EAB|nr:hypothetical protein [Cupriavidus sp. TA19]GLC97068.1 hypothetical protein Tamer19_64770 [Cupriavidus sp. TA19]
MIKIDIDLRDATNAEIDTFYGMPGFGNVLRELKDSGNRYNAVLTIREPRDESEALVSLLMEFMRKQKMQVGDVIPEKPFRFEFVPFLNPRQQEIFASHVRVLRNIQMASERRRGIQTHRRWLSMPVLTPRKS